MKSTKAGHWIFWLSIIGIVAVAIIGLTAMKTPSDQIQGDTTGNATGSAENLVGLAPADISQSQLDKAATNEPFAYQLATAVNENRLASNFIWTLICGFLVMFMQAMALLQE